VAERGITISYEANRLWCNNINGGSVKTMAWGLIAAFDSHWSNGLLNSIVCSLSKKSKIKEYYLCRK